MSLFKRLFRGSKESAVVPKKEAEFKIIDTHDIAEAQQYSFKDIQSRKIDGMIFRNLLSKEECDTIVKKFYTSQGLEGDPENALFFPPNLFYLSNNKDQNQDEIDEYYGKSKEYVDNFEQNYGIDLHQRIFDLIQKIDPSIETEIPSGQEGGYYLPSTFRSLSPEKQVMYLHCENQVANLFEREYKFLSTFANVYDSMSFFIVLQKPEKGGRIALYELEWKDAEDALPSSSTVVLKDGRQVDLEDVNCEFANKKYLLNEGDILFFAGGQMWHAVETVQGSKNRVTFGGFMGFGTKDPNKLYVWS